MASSEIRNGWQSPRLSYTLDLSQTETERPISDWQSPRISFSLNLSQSDRISPEKRKRQDVADLNYDTDFEFCVATNNNDRHSIFEEALLSVADELFMDGKILPLSRPTEAQPVTIASHLGLENSRCRSPVRSTSYPPSKITSGCSGDVASKSSRHKPPSKWKEIMLKLSNKENACAEIRGTPSKLVDQDRSGNNVKQQPSSTRSRWPFSRSCSTGSGETKGNSLFCSLPFSRSHSTAERKHKAATSAFCYRSRSVGAQCTSKEIEIDLSGPVEGSKPPEGWSICNKVQPDPRYLGDLKPRFQAEDGKAETKARKTRGRSKGSSPGRPLKIRGGLSSHRNTGRVVGNGRLMVRNLERSSSSTAKVTSLDSPRPGRPMADGCLLVKSNSIGGVRVNPVLNVPACIGIGYVGGGWNGGGSLFGFRGLFSKRDKKQPSTYDHHYHASTNRKKGA